jgi:iron complex transport system substrate-binding protein
MSCTRQSSGYGTENQVLDQHPEIKYAQGFSVYKFDDYTKITIMNPWVKGQVMRSYILVDKTKQTPENLPDGTVIRVPLGRVVCYSSVHCSVLDELDVIDSVVGVCEPRYIDVPAVREKIKDGSIIDIGMASNPDVEKIMLISPDAILTSPLKEVGYGKVENVGIPIIDCVDYMESTPLGRTEWIRFLALLFDKETLADSLFAKTEQSYNELKTLASSVKERPSVMTEKEYGNIWYLPGGQSYMAHLLRDAGSAYFWENDSTTGSLSFSFETVLDKCEHADYWLIKYFNDKELDYSQLEAEYAPYASFDAFKNKSIFACNTSKNRYYEELPVHPDYVLKELIAIFHPELLPGYRQKYYKKLRDEK